MRSYAALNRGRVARLFATVGLLALAPAFSSDAAAHLQFDSWTTENGLPQNSVNDILQTRDGYLWLATFGGLVRFDGARFVVFDRSVDGILSQRVRVLHEDKRGMLWAATEDGMLIRYGGGRFITYSSKEGLPDARAVRIEEDDNGNLWITWEGSITRFDGQRFQQFEPRHFGDRVAAPPADRYTDTWWRHDRDGFRALVGGRVREYSIDAELNGASVRGVSTDRCGNVWITTTAAGLIKAGPDGVRRHIPRDSLPVRHGDAMFVADCHDNVWVQDWRWNVYRVRHGQAERIAVPPIHALYQDRDGSVWLGTSGGGLRRVRESSIGMVTVREGLSFDEVYSILEDRAGAIWIGTWDAGLNQYVGGRSQSYAVADGLPSFRISSIYQDRSGRLWVGTEKGLSYFDGDRFKRYEDASGYLRATIWAMLEDHAGTFWYATDRGLVRSGGGSVTRYTTRDGLTHDRTSTLFEDRSGALWIGTYQGLTRLKNGVFSSYTDRHGLIGNTVRAIHEDDDGVLWLGTYDGGLYRLSGDRLTRFTRNEGLHDNGVFQILSDGDGNFWMGSNRGISRISRRELNEVAEGKRRFVSPVVLGARDGLASVEVNGGRQPAGMRTADGRLWFPTMGGVAIIDPRAFATRATPPSAIIEEFRLTGRPVDFLREVRIPSDAGAFEIRYTAPSFIKPDQLRFRYRLVGLDNDWIEAGDQRSASFFRIPSGRYRFEVNAAIDAGQWGTSAPAVDILVLAPFWRTSSFMALVLCAVSSIALAAHLVRVRRLRRLHALQEAFSRTLIESQEGERHRIATEMHDSLGQELAVIRKVARGRRESAADLEGAMEALHEISAVAERLDAQMKEIAYGLRPHQLDTIGLSRTIESMVRRVGRACEVEFITDVECIDDLLPPGAHIHIFRIVQEAVSNIVRHSNASEARVTVKIGVTSIELKVEDNGSGVGPAHGAPTPSPDKGFGLVGIRERTRVLGGHVEVVSDTGSGTAVVVTLPFQDAVLG